MTTHLNSPLLPRNPAFSQAVAVAPWATTIHVGGQNAVGADGSVPVDDVREQVVGALRNLELVLSEGDATLDDVVSWSVLLVEGVSLTDAVAGFRSVWGGHKDPPAITVAVVAGLADPRFLVEISAIAAVVR